MPKCAVELRGTESGEDSQSQCVIPLPTLLLILFLFSFLNIKTLIHAVFKKLTSSTSLVLSGIWGFFCNWTKQLCCYVSLLSINLSFIVLLGCTIAQLLPFFRSPYFNCSVVHELHTGLIHHSVCP